jgi:hypothetical protein
MCSTLVFRNIDPVSLEPILIGGEKLLKPALRLISVYRLRIDEIRADTVVTSFTRWLEAVKPEERRIRKFTSHSADNLSASGSNQRSAFWTIWNRSRLILDSEASTLSDCTIGRKSTSRQGLNALIKCISLEELRKVLGLESVKDAAGNIIQQPPLPIWANFRQRALDIGISEINEKTDLNISLESLERSKHRAGDRVDFYD